MINFLGKRVGYFLLLLVFAPATFAGVILAELEKLDETRWMANYSLTNTLTTEFDQFTIYFQHGSYENLSLVAAPSDWDPLVIQPDPLLSGDGFFDALSMGSPLLPGDSLSGFSVAFDWAGSGDPGSQWFELIDSFSFDVLYSGLTQVQDVVAPVSEPTGLSLSIIGLISLLMLRRKACQTRTNILTV